MLSRRSLCQASASFLLTGFIEPCVAKAAERGLAAPPVALRNVKALFFDVFGTLVDWRTGVAKGSEAILRPRGVIVDWLSFADAWRAEYMPITELVRSGRAPYVKLDTLEREMLERILPTFGITNLPEDVKRELTLTWHRLNGWPDVRGALGRLAKRYKLAPVSNGNISMMADIAAHNGWRWDAILGADIAHDFKPKQDVYLAAAAAFSLTPAECMMVAAHEVDLVHGGASAAGLHTAFIARPNEYGLPAKSRTYLKEADVSVMSLAGLADKLGA